MHCGLQYRHYNHIRFLLKVQPFLCGKTPLQITVFRMCGIPYINYYNVLSRAFTAGRALQYCCA